MVGGKTLGQSLGIVVGALDQWLTGDVVRHILLGRVEDLVVRAAGSRVHQPAGDASHEQRVIDLQLNGVLKLLLADSEHVVQALCLSNGSGETVQDETAIARQLNSVTCPATVFGFLPILALAVVVQFTLDHVDHDLVANQTTLVHDLLRLLAEVGLLRNLGSQHVSGSLFRKSVSKRLPFCIWSCHYVPGGTRSTCP